MQKLADHNKLFNIREAIKLDRKNSDEFEHDEKQVKKGAKEVLVNKENNVNVVVGQGDNSSRSPTAKQT